MTIPIVYNGGVYGTYLEWCLTTLCSDIDLQPPFSNTGNSHGFIGNHLYDFTGWKKFLNDNKTNQFVRFHPKVKTQESVTDHLNQTCDVAEFVIHLYPDPDSIVLCINNAYTKIHYNWWKYFFDSGRLDINQIYNNWPVQPGTNIDEIPNWIKREFLSYFLVDVYYKQLDWYHPDHWSSPNCIVVTVNNLLYNFEQALTNIKNFCHLEFVKPIDSLKSYHLQNLSLQKYADQDKICKNILKNTLAQIEMSWQPLPLPSEAWLQQQLRTLGHGIRCNGLDTFPTNSLQLAKLLHPL